MSLTTYDISGMHCASCVGRVERTLLALPDVTLARVNLALEEAIVEGLPDSAAEARVAQAITDSGYKAKIKVAGAGRQEQVERRQSQVRTLAFQTLIAGLLTFPVFVVEMGGHIYPPMHHWVFSIVGQTNSWFAQFLLITLVMIWPGRSFYILGLPKLFRGAPDMNALVAIGTLAAWGYSVVSLFAPSLLPMGNLAVYFEAAGVIITLILLGRFLEARAKGRTGDAIARLVGLRAKTAMVLRNEQWIEIAADQIQIGDEIQLRPGETVPADAVVLTGQSFIDESMITGEPMPVDKGPNAEVIGGTVNGTGSLTIQAARVGEASALAQIIRMVEDAQGTRLPIQDLVNRVTLWFVPAVMVLATITLIAWLTFGQAPALQFALVTAVCVLIVACPCAMGLATPTSIMVGAGRSAELGVLFRKGDALQQLQSIKTIVFDKTGTLTKGTPVVTEFEHDAAFDRAHILTLIAGLEQCSEHPVAKAIVLRAVEEGVAIPKAADFQAFAGRGATATVLDHIIEVGTALFMREMGHQVGDFGSKAQGWALQGKTPVFIAINHQVAAVFAVSDEIKPEARGIVAQLQNKGISVAMVSGDRDETAQYVAKALGISNVVSEAKPAGKLAALATMTGPVAFVGDGINDAPALAKADVGIAIGTGTDVAIEAADVVMMSGDLNAVVNAVTISQMTMRNIKQNLFWAFAYNALLIPVAAGVFYPALGLLLSPALAAGAMALSSVFVLSNALRLRWVSAA
jgi:heavy metal translocating P-type ATPase